MGLFKRDLVRHLGWQIVILCVSAAGVAAQTGTTALFLDSKPGDSVGGGTIRTLTTADATFTATSSGTRVTVRLTAPSSFNTLWSLEFSVPAGQTFPVLAPPQAPAEFINARRSPFTTFTGLSISSSSTSCFRSTGRFVVLEAEFGPTGSLTKFAADFEQHCATDTTDSAAGLFGAIRFQSTVSSLTPFGGVYPSFSLTVDTPDHGNVSSPDGLSCGAGGVVCQLTTGAAKVMTLTATPDPGYVFAGWTDECSGGATTTLHVNAPKRCTARFEPAAVDSRHLVVLDSLPGDTIGRGGRQVYSPSNRNSRLTASTFSTGSSVTFSVEATDPVDTVAWSFTFSVPSGQTLQPGVYEGALSTNSGLRPGISVRGYTSCTSSGRFVVHELALGSGGSVARAAIDFEHHCSTTDAGLFGAIRYNSTVDSVVPLAGAYPIYRLTIGAPAHGTISGGSLHCGTGGAACLTEPATPVSVSLTATPDPGYVFAGWTGDCFGASTATVRVNTIRACSAAFEAIAGGSPRTIVFIDAQAGARFSGSEALQEVFSSASTSMAATSSQSGRRVRMDFAFVRPDGFADSRNIEFGVPAGQSLVAGRSYAPTMVSSAQVTPGFDYDFTCSRFTGRFVIRELSIANDGTVLQLAADFEQHCNDTDPAIFGAVRFNSSLDARPFDGAYPQFRLSVTRPEAGRVTSSDGIDCAAAGGACDAASSVVHAATMTAIPDPGFDFAGWTGACHGGATINVNVNGVKECAALFEPAPNPSRTRLTMVSQVGEPVLLGRNEVYSLPNSAWIAFISTDRKTLSFNVTGRIDQEERTFRLEFRSRTADPLQPGTYTSANNSFSSGQTVPYMEISGPGFCTVVGSRFVIRELVVSAASKVTRAAVDFEQHCNSAGAPALTGTIEYTEAGSVPVISLDKRTLSFASQVMPDNTIGNTTAPQQIRISQTGSSPVSWTITNADPLLVVTPASGTGPRTITVSVQPGLAGIGTSTHTFTVNAAGTSIAVTVVWTLHGQVTTPPFGRFETPIAQTQNLSGSVPLTGWVLDDIDVTEVQIWRLPHASDPPAAISQAPGPQFGKVFIGNAALIDGARPDVEAAFNLPNRSRAGWGYMLLTRGLVWDGQGFMTVYAIARDRDGHVTEIGSTFFSIDNALSTKPFGTIDTPGQGATASGLFGNTGWVLPGASGATIPASGVRVMIDGVFLTGTPSMSARNDITSMFPAFDTSQAGRGLFVDTRTYADGMHTIAWIVTDSHGNSEGIGSRFFRIANGGLDSLRAAERAASRPVANVSIDDVDAAAGTIFPIRVRRGFDPETPFETIWGSPEPAAVDFEELDRLELRLTPEKDATYTGYLRALGQLRPLPAGASLDPSSGTFTWQPPAGFLGHYDLVFVARTRHGIASRHDVRVRVRPRSK